ncbi:uncharacterized protein LOC130053332 isoform X2 [Ostrea edulis]|nr:uncharacterized protein LOC130053332 isoform X2 [Ostrea edulis]
MDVYEREVGDCGEIPEMYKTCGQWPCVPVNASCPCKPEEFSCSDDTCISQSLLCNGVKECENGNDELMCNSYGSSGDAQIYNNSEFKELVEDGSINFPDPDPLSHDNMDIPYFLVGDDDFSLAKNMMKPYGQRDLSREQRILNYRLSRARRVSENAFGIISNRFQILASKMNHLPSTARLIVKTCCILHNLMRMHYPVMNNALIEHDEIRGNPVPGAWRRGRNLHDTVIVTGNNNQNKDGKKIRNLLKHWCNSEVGSVPWQDRMVP